MVSGSIRKFMTNKNCNTVIACEYGRMLLIPCDLSKIYKKVDSCGDTNESVPFPFRRLIKIKHGKISIP